MFSLGMIAYNRMELVSLVHPYLTEMAEKSGETCHASILDDGVHVMFIDRVLGTSFLKMDTAIGFMPITRQPARRSWHFSRNRL